MAYIALQLDGATMPWPSLPDGYSETRSFQQVFRELSDGTIAQQVLKVDPNVIVFDLTWKGLTLSEYGTIATAYNGMVGTTVLMRTITGGNYLVRHNPQSPTMTVRYYKLGGAEAVDVRISLQTTDPPQVV